jgi:hypothetical protein
MSQPRKSRGWLFHAPDMPQKMVAAMAYLLHGDRRNTTGKKAPSCLIWYSQPPRWRHCPHPPLSARPISTVLYAAPCVPLAAVVVSGLSECTEQRQALLDPPLPPRRRVVCHGRSHPLRAPALGATVGSTDVTAVRDINASGFPQKHRRRRQPLSTACLCPGGSDAGSPVVTGTKRPSATLQTNRAG